MKFSELKGQAVVSLDDTQQIAELEDLMVEIPSRHIVSLKVRASFFSAAQFVPAGAVKHVGPDAVTIAANVTPSSQCAASSQPLVALTTILGNQVVTEAGTLVGEVCDVLLDWTALTITGYEVREGNMFTQVQEFPAPPEGRLGDKQITVPAQLLRGPTLRGFYL